MGHEVTFEAVVPVAFFSPDNVEMTAAFLEALQREPELERARLYLNGGNGYAVAGEKACQESGFECVDAHGWPFYRMWNEGISSSSLPCLVLNNDIRWPKGELKLLADELEKHKYTYGSNVAITYPRFEPDSRGLAGWCFAIDPEAFRRAGPIDETYKTWFGDDEMVLQLRRAGYRTQSVVAQVAHLVTMTMMYQPDYEENKWEDMRRFEAKWGTWETQWTPSLLT